MEVEDFEDRQEVINYFLEEFLPQFLDTLELLLQNSDGIYLAGSEVQKFQNELEKKSELLSKNVRGGRLPGIFEKFLLFKLSI